MYAPRVADIFVLGMVQDGALDKVNEIDAQNRTILSVRGDGEKVWVQVFVEDVAVAEDAAEGGDLLYWVEKEMKP